MKARLFIAAAVLAVGVSQLHAATITITSTADNGPGSLRYALASAANGDTIDASGVSGTILLTNGELLVTNSVDIVGSGPGLLAVNGNAASSVFHMSPSTTVSVSSLTITNGRASGDYPANLGGGIYNDHAALILSNCVIAGNMANFAGGGVCNDGFLGTATLTVVNTVLTGNSAVGGAGGGIDNDGVAGSASLAIENSILIGNSAAAGGGLHSDSLNGKAIVEVRNSTLASNSATDAGGGIHNDSGGGTVVIIANSTLSDNLAVTGGGVFSLSGLLTVSNSTLSGNSATNGGGIYNQSTVLRVGGTILNTGTAGVNIANNGGTITSLGYNLSSDDGGGFLTATGDQINTDPMLGPLQDNGGPTFTCALLPGSPAINAGDPNFTPPPDFDQRGPGFPRIVCGRIDIGAFEVQDRPTITCPANIVADATSPRGAVVYFTPTAVNECSSVSISSTPSSGTLFAIGDTTVTCTAIDGAGNQATCSFTVNVKGAAEQIDDLIALVRALNLKPWTTYILTAELQSASNALRRGYTRAGCIDLDAFIFEVNVQTWWGQLWPPSRARLLIRNAQRIQNVLGCYDDFGPGHY